VRNGREFRWSLLVVDCHFVVQRYCFFDLLSHFVEHFVTEGGMTLYLKAAADGTLVGDCPFAHFVRLVLEEKGLQYELKPCTEDTKPAWLTEYYEGKLPALRHRKECYVESDVIADYLDFFFPDPSLKGGKKEMDEAEDAISGFFPSVAKYLKHIPDGDDEDQEMKCSLESVLLRLEEHLQLENRTGPYLVGNGEKLTLLDCSLSPKLYHLRTGIEAFKDNAIDLAQKFPAVNEYLDSMLKRESFQKTVYDKDVIIWGWSNTRK
jgi:glutathione S-transferase